MMIEYKKYNDYALIEEISGWLKEFLILHEIVDNSSTLPSFLDNRGTKEYILKINKEDIDTVQSIIEQKQIESLDDIDKDYYLFSFTDKELMEVIYKKEEWNELDYLLARKLLKERGIDLQDKEVNLVREMRIESLKQTEPDQKIWIIAGYFCTALGGILGIFIGWYIKTATKTLPNGEKFYIFSDANRRQGDILMKISINP